MNCPTCGHDVPTGSAFCNSCGAKLVIACASCGATPPPGSRFCNGCGGTIGAAPASAAPERQPRDYTPKHLADKILQSKSALEGERKQVTVLFADVKGSMELAEQLDPEEWHAILDRFFAILTDGVHRFEGTVNQYTGDGIMALFGAPIAHEDHAQRACYAALHLRDEIARYATEVKREHGVGFSTRMGLNSGEVVVGAIGDDLRMDYTAQGHTVGLAQRMESLAEPNTCFLTDTTAAMTRGYFALDDLGEFRVKGVAAPVRIHRLSGIGASRSRFDLSRSRGLSRFVGRASDLRTLEDALEQTDAGNGQAVGIMAEAGTGKSRLCFEFLERCRARGMKIFEGRAVAHGRNIPLLPILEVFRSFFGITTQDDDRSAREKIAGRMVLLDQAFAETLPLIFDFLGVADPQRPAPRLDPEVRQRQIIAVMRQLTHTVNEAQPTVTMIEDLHWLDPASAEFIEHMVDARAGTRNLLLLNFRPEYRADWMQKSWYRQIPLTPLGRDAIAELLSDLLGTHPSLAALAGPIHARTGGNPFFTEEVVQSLIESGHLEGARGAYKLVTPVERLEVPATIQAILAARIDRLPEREKRLLQVASVIGKDFAEPLLAAVADLPANDLKVSLAALRRAEFIHEQSIYPVVEYSFKHPLTQEVALGSQLKERRRQIHAAVARAIEQQDAAHLDELAPLLAHHWEEAADSEQAVRWHHRAAEWADARDAVAGLRHWHKVRELGRSLADAATMESRFRACKMILAGGTWRIGMSEQDARQCLDEARELAQAVGRPEDLAVPLAGFALSRGVRGHADAALAFSREAHAMLHDGMGIGEILYVSCIHTWSVLVTGHVERAIEALDEIVLRSGGDPQRGREVAGLSPTIWANLMAARALANAGKFDACWVRAERAIQTAREIDDQEDFCMSIQSLSLCVYLAGGTSGAPVADLRRTCAEALETATTLGNRGVLNAARWARGIADFVSGDFETAEAHLGESMADAHLSGTGLEWHGYVLAVFADSCRARGDNEAAIARAREAVEFTRAGGFGLQAALGHAVLADALAGAGAPADEVAAAIAESRRISEKVGGNALLPRLREAELRLAARHDPALLTAGLREAEKMYRAMGAIGHAERLARELTS